MVILSEHGIYILKDNVINRIKSVALVNERNDFKNIEIRGEDTILMTRGGTIVINKKGVVTYNNGKRSYCYTRYKNLQLIGTQDSILCINSNYQSYSGTRMLSRRFTDIKSIDDYLILSTSDDGIYIFLNDKIHKHLTTENGLCSNNCGKMLIYEGKIFVCSDNGISIINWQDFNVNVVTESNGLVSNEVNECVIAHDTLLVATNSGVSLIPLQNVFTQSSQNLFVKPYSIGTDTFWNTCKKIIAHTDIIIDLKVNYTSLLKISKRNLYYKIVGVDSQFKKTVSNKISFTIDKTGFYVMEIYGLNSAGEKSKLLRIPIDIIPKFYQTKIFIFGLSIILISLMILIVKVYQHQAKIKEQKKAAEEKRIRGLELAAWRATVNPHFLFNSLNGFQAFFRRNEFDKGNFYLSTFTQMLRNTVDSSSDITITVEQEIEFLREFLEFEQNKKEKIFKFKIEVDQASTLDLFIPTLLVQQVLENCIKHAFLDDKEGFVLVRFSTENEQLIARIRDNGPGLQISEKEAKKSVGIALIRYKMRIVEKLVNSPTDFLMKNVIDKKGNPAGLETTLVFPLITKRLKIDMHEQQEDENTVIEMIEDDNLNPENDDEELNSRKSENAD